MSAVLSGAPSVRRPSFCGSTASSSACMAECTLLKQVATSAATAPRRCASRPASELKISASPLRSSCSAMGLAPC